MRAFLAVPMDSAVRDRYVRLRAGALSGLESLRWVRPENLHLTMRFLGDVEEARVERLRAEIVPLLAPLARFRLTLGQPGCFGPPRRPRALWFGIDVGADELAHLAEAVETGVRRLGFSPEEKPWNGHLTLARNPRRTPVEGWESVLGESGLPGLGFEVEGIWLFSSRMRAEGPEYTEVWRVGLGGQPW